MLVLCFAMGLISAGAVSASASGNLLTIDFDKDEDINTSNQSDFYWVNSATREVPSLSAEDGMKQGKFVGISGTNQHELKFTDPNRFGENYVVEMKIKRTTTDYFGVIVTGDNAAGESKQISAYKITGANSVVVLPQTGKTIDGKANVTLGASNGAGAYDTIYLHVNAAADKCKVYANSVNNSAEYDYDGSGKISSIRFEMTENNNNSDIGTAYVDYIKIYPAADFVPPILNIGFENDKSSGSKNTAVWSSTTTLAYENANGIGTAKMYADSENASKNYLLSLTKAPSGEIIIETKVKITSVNEFNMCYTVNGKVSGTETASDGYLNLKTTNDTKAFYDVNNAKYIDGAYYEPDVIPAAPNFNTGWNTIYVRLNTTTGKYYAYINSAEASTGDIKKSGNVIVNSSLKSIRFDCTYKKGDNANVYVDYIKIYDASGWNLPAAEAKCSIDDNFDSYAEGASAFTGLINTTNDANFSAVVAKDPKNSENNCLKISGTAQSNMIFDIGINSANAVIEYKSYLSDKSYCQAANIINTDSSNSYVVSYDAGDKEKVNLRLGSGDVKSTKISDGWNTFKYIIDTNEKDADGYTLYTFVNGRFADKQVYSGTVKNLRMSVPTTENVNLYIDDFSVKYNQGFNITTPVVYKDGEVLSSSGTVKKDDTVEINYTALNSGSENAAKKVIFAVYKNDGGILSIAQATVIPAAYTSYSSGFKKIEHSVNLETDVNFDNGDVIKVFCWNDAGTLIPFTEAVEIKK